MLRNSPSDDWGLLLLEEIMTRFELTLNPNYVEHWGLWEAFRELKQNTLDRQFQNNLSKEILTYDHTENKMVIGNKMTSLDKKTLLLGYTTKKGNSCYVGQYGEGFKLSLLVLLRNGVNVEIENGNELWLPKIINSRRFDSKILVVDVKKNPNKNNKDLIFKLDGISKDTYSKLIDRCLDLQPESEKIKSYNGEILLDEKYAGHLYVKGLFVTNKTGLDFGYNLSPENINLDRDRNRVNDFDLRWETSRMWSYVNEEKYGELFYKLIREKAIDVDLVENHMDNFNKDDKMYNDICQMSYKDFLKKYGENAVAVDNDEEAQLIKAKYGDLVPVVLPKVIKKFVTHFCSLNGINIDKTAEASRLKNPCHILNNFYNSYIADLDNFEEAKMEFLRIIEKARSWKV
jgi:hypothetical protein